MRALALLLASVIALSAQHAQQPPTPPMIIEPGDADAFREIIETTIPPRYNGAIIHWYTAILQRQQEKAKAAAETKAKPSEEAK